MTPLLLLRPLAGSSTLWGRFHDELAATRPVITCEHRRRVSTRAMARDAAALLDDLGIRSAHVFGLSLGGMVATWLAIDRPALVDRLVLASTPPRGSDALSARLDFVTAWPRGEAELARHVLSARFRGEQPARAAAILDEIGVGSRRTVLLHAMAAAFHDPTRELMRLRAPTLCIAGSLDDLVEPRAIAELARRVPHGHFQMIAGAGHDLSLEAPLELARLVNAFLDTNRAGFALDILRAVYESETSTQ